MGSASSKASRVFPKCSPAPWAGARTAGPSETAPTPPTQGTPSGAEGELRGSGSAKASAQRTAEIEKDAGDPDFLTALNRLGPVRVDHGMETVRTRQAAQMNETTRLFQSRAASEDEASSQRPSHNHLYAGALHELLNARKSARTRADLENLAKKYGMDAQKLESLARVVNAPSVDSRLNVKVVDKNADERTIMTAVWVNPPLQTST